MKKASKMRVKFSFVPLPEFTLKGEQYDAAKTYEHVGPAFHTDLLKLKQALERSGKTPRVLFLLDEIELMIPHGSSEGFDGHQKFFRQLRGLHQSTGFVTSAVVGADLTPLRAGRWGQRDNPVFQYYDEVFLSFLERRECKEMVTALGDVMGIAFDPEALKLIVDESGAHPYVTRQLCSSIVSHYQDRDRPVTVEAAMVLEGINDYIFKRPEYFSGLFRGYVSRTGQSVLLQMATEDTSHVQHHQLAESVQKKHNLGPRETQAALQNLEIYHFLGREGETMYFRIPLMRRWLRASMLGLE